MKKIIALLMAVLTVVTAFTMAIPAFAEETTKWYQYTQEECKHNSMIPGDRYYGPEYYFKNSDTCFLCGYVCEHPADKRVYYVDITTSKYDSFDYNSEGHTKLYKCEYCCKSSIADESTTEKHKYGKWETKASWYEESHTRKCTVCDYKESGTCTYKKSYKKSTNDKTHGVMLKCTVCKQQGYIAKDIENHTYKNNVCTKCGFKRIVPGALKINKATNATKGKKRTVNVDGKWVYSNGEYIWKKPYKYTCYDYKIDVKVTSKNAVKYLVNTAADKELDDGRNNRKIFQKNTFTYTYTGIRNKKATKFTIYITPISKTGTYGKTVKKTITLKN